MLRRHIVGQIEAALEDTPVVFINGARQTGKSPLVQWLLRNGHPARYWTLDDAATLAAVKTDPAGFLATHKGPIAVDEVQRAPELFNAIKADVDRARRPGRFLLTGSADVMLLPGLAESLAGRMEILTLWPLSRGEIARKPETFLDALFSAPQADWSEARPYRAKLLGMLLAGGYPESLQRPAEPRRKAWFRSYVSAILQRDVRDLAQIEGLSLLPRMLSLIAAQAAGVLNIADFARRLAAPHSTITRYWTLLEATFLVQPLPAWSANLGRRLVKAPKVFLNDCGLLAHLLGMDLARLTAEPVLLGPLLENFVVMELRKQQSWCASRPELFHFRTHAGCEVDIVVEQPSGKIAGIEVKASSTVGPGDFRGLRALREATGERFHGGVLPYMGTDCLPFGDRLLAMPVTAIWRPSP